MSIISISRGSYSRGVAVAEKVASSLQYTCLARDAVLEASDAYDVEEIKLLRAIETRPSILDRLTGGKARYMAYIRATLLKHFLADNIVYHGQAGHYFLQGVPHALKVRILADPADRVASVIASDGLSEEEAHKALAASDRVRRQWGLHLYGIDTEDASLYDAVIHVGRMGTDGAADTICSLVHHEAFQTTPASQAALQDMALAAAVEANIVEMGQGHEATVSAQDGEVLVKVRVPRLRGGGYSGFRERYLTDLEGRLRAQSLSLPLIRSLEVVCDD